MNSGVVYIYICMIYLKIEIIYGKYIIQILVMRYIINTNIKYLIYFYHINVIYNIHIVYLIG